MKGMRINWEVLILVVMDVALGLLDFKTQWNHEKFVLILVVMDVALGLLKMISLEKTLLSLNPCCNGCRTWTSLDTILDIVRVSLNPCCNGCRTWTD